ncbi:MAG TPA: glycosyltransferase [Vicinamibacteria bacterium]
MTPPGRARVLFVLTSSVRGGVEEVVASLLRRLDPAAFALGLAAPPALLDQLGPDLAGTGVATFAAQADSWARPREIGALAGAIRRFRPHLVNTHLFRSSLVAAPLARALGVRRVVETYHGREGWRRSRLSRSFWADRVVGRAVDLFVAVSRAAADFLVESKRVPARKVVVVPNGRDLDLFRPGDGGAALRAQLGIAASTPVVGVVARLEPQKGHAYALEAFAEVRRARPAARMLLAGDGSLRAALESHAAALGLRDAVVFLGHRTDLPPVIDAMDLVLLPSLYEGMPLSVIEASAMGKPVVATAIDGTPEVLEDGQTGLLVPPGDAPALARAALRLLDDPEQTRRMGEAGRRRALARFDVRAQVQATTRVFEAVLEGRGAPVPAGGAPEGLGERPARSWS